MSIIEKAAQHLEGLLRQERPAPEAATTTGAQGGPAPAGGQNQMRAAVSRQVEIDLAALKAAGFVTPDVTGSLIAEEFRVIKRPILANVVSRTLPSIRNANLIMVTSALPGEGKSFTALNLAMSIAMEFDRTVLLVDADVARPSLPSVLGLPEQEGLLDVLQGKTTLPDVLLRTNIEKLTLLTAGSPDAHATELLASDGMTRLLNEMAKRYSDRIIIFDSPPLLMTTESRVLANQMGQIIMVVQAEETLQNAVIQALTTIEACPVKALVLNKARNVDQMVYGYGYGYGYGR